MSARRYIICALIKHVIFGEQNNFQSICQPASYPIMQDYIKLWLLTHIINSVEGMFLPLSVCLSVCLLDY